MQKENILEPLITDETLSNIKEKWKNTISSLFLSKQKYLIMGGQIKKDLYWDQAMISVFNLKNGKLIGIQFNLKAMGFLIMMMRSIQYIILNSKDKKLF
jgi:hypothetical protein